MIAATKEPDLSGKIATTQALVNSLAEVLSDVRGSCDALGLSALLCADAVLTMIAIKLDEAESDAMAIERRVAA